MRFYFIHKRKTAEIKVTVQQGVNEVREKLNKLKKPYSRRQNFAKLQNNTINKVEIMVGGNKLYETVKKLRVIIVYKNPKL